MRFVKSTTAAIGALTLGIATAPAASAATSFGGRSNVGVLFPNTSASGAHTCTASVLASSTRDTIITAAHCLSGSGTNYTFAPSYHGGTFPYGKWRVAKAYVDPRWKSSRDPRYDVAVLKLNKQYIGGRWKGVQDVTWGALQLAYAPASGTSVVVPGYVAGQYDWPITCTARVYYTSGYPGFTCSGYYGGTSGSPFIKNVGGVNYVAGVIGGLHQGGCVSWVSYSSPFNSAVFTLRNRAQANYAGDWLPYPGSDGC